MSCQTSDVSPRTGKNQLRTGLSHLSYTIAWSLVFLPTITLCTAATHSIPRLSEWPVKLRLKPNTLLPISQYYCARCVRSDSRSGRLTLVTLIQGINVPESTSMEREFRRSRCDRLQLSSVTEDIFYCPGGGDHSGRMWFFFLHSAVLTPPPNSFQKHLKCYARLRQTLLSQQWHCHPKTVRPERTTLSSLRLSYTLASPSSKLKSVGMKM
jgi:hypothetical protein